jgi:hypothetical protein
MNRQNKGFGMLLVLVFVLVLVIGFYLANAKKELSNKKSVYQPKSQELIDDVSTKGDSFAEIESDLNETVILEEDFSDL